MGSSYEYNRAYYLANKEKFLAYATDYNKKRREEGRTPIRPYYNRYRLSGMEQRHLDKIKVLSYYSNPQGIPICNNCGEQDIDVLCLDHIDGGGNKHVDSLTTTLYGWVLQNNFPTGFQVLCANCNLKKARLEYKGKSSKLSTVELSTN